MGDFSFAASAFPRDRLQLSSVFSRWLAGRALVHARPAAAIGFGTVLFVQLKHDLADRIDGVTWFGLHSPGIGVTLVGEPDSGWDVWLGWWLFRRVYRITAEFTCRGFVELDHAPRSILQ